MGLACREFSTTIPVWKCREAGIDTTVQGSVRDNVIPFSVIGKEKALIKFHWFAKKPLNNLVSDVRSNLVFHRINRNKMGVKEGGFK